DAVSLGIRRGEIFCLLGGSGSGKTTLLRMLAGFERPSGGAIHIDGEDMSAIPPYERPVNMMFQSYALFPHMSVERNIAFGLEQEGLQRAEIRRQVGDILDIVKMGGFGSRLGVMNHGRIAQVGTPSDIYESPVTRFVADFIGSVNMFEGRVSEDGAECVRIRSEELGCTVRAERSVHCVGGSTVWTAIR